MSEADIGKRRLKDITTAHVAKFLEEVEGESGEATANAVRARMSDVFRSAETQGLIDVGRSLVTGIRAPRPQVKRERLPLEPRRPCDEQRSIERIPECPRGGWNQGG